jgi:hypothetical protein
MLNRVCLMTAIIGLLVVGAQESARAQISGAVSSDASSPLTFNLTPYLWLPTIDSTLKYPVRGGGTATATMSVGPGDWIPKFNIGALLAGEVRYERFSLLTDLLYMNVGTSVGRIKSFDQGQTSIPVDGAVSAGLSTRLGSTIWTLGGGYTVAEGNWGNIDLLAGFRLLSIHDTTNFSLSAVIARPDGSIALGRTGGLSADATFVNGIGGVRGRFNLASQDWLGGGRSICRTISTSGLGDQI